MTQEQYNWLKDNYTVLGNVKMTREQLKTVFDIYNAITNENKPITSCGRCVYNIKQRLKVEYEIFQSLQNSKG